MIPNELLPIVSLSVAVVILFCNLFLRPYHQKWLYGILIVLLLTSTLCVIILPFHMSQTTFLYDTISLLPLTKTIVIVLFLSLLISSILFILIPKIGIHDPNYAQSIFLSVIGGFGALTAVMSQELITVYVAFELLSVSSYFLVAIQSGKAPLEAGIKYTIVGLASSVFFLSSLALYSGIGHTTFLPQLQYALTTQNVSPFLLTVSFVLLLIGLSFKMGTFPAQSWLPDVYSGTSLPAMLFVATIPKLAGLGFLYRIMIHMSDNTPFAKEILILTAIGGMLYGAPLALLQKNIRRLFGYSSIVHASMLMLIIAISSTTTAFSYYIVTYTLSMSGIVAYLLWSTCCVVDNDILNNHRDVLQHTPSMGMSILLLVLSLAGLPPLMGFWAKLFFFIVLIKELPLKIGVGICVVLLIPILIGFAYYLGICHTFLVSLPSRIALLKKKMSTQAERELTSRSPHAVALRDKTRLPYRIVWLITVCMALLSLLFGLVPNFVMSIFL